MGIFYRWGNLIHKRRWLIILFWCVLFLCCLPLVTQLTTPFKAIGFKDPESESAKASQLINNKLGYSYNRFIVMFTTTKTFNSTYLDEIKDSLVDLKKFPIQHKIIYPTFDNKQISKDKKAAYALILFKSAQEIEPALLENFTKLIKQPPNLVVQLGGEPVFMRDTKIQTQRDMYKTEYIATPVSIITMLVVFGSIIAALIPIFLGGFSVFFILVSLFLLAQYFNLSVFTINIALLLGLCLSLDYSLLIISRFRDELAKERSTQEAIAITQATAGKSVFFSGLAVFISLSALLLFRINVLFSVGIGGLAAVFVSVGIAIFLLPALLSVLNHRINLLKIRLFKQKSIARSYWHWLAKKIEKKSLAFLVIILILLLALGYPFLNAKIGISDFRILPKNLESRDVFDIFQNKFGENKLDPIFLIVKSSNSKILTKRNIADLYDFSNRIKENNLVSDVTSIVNTKPRLSKDQYQMMYTQGRDHLPKALDEYLEITTKGNLTVFTVISKTNGNSPQTKKLIEDLRHMQVGKNLSLELTGGTVNTIDVKKSITQAFPWAFLWIVGFTYLILLVSLRSVILPLKAIITTMLSLCASYGVLVLVFQEGYLHHLLNFEPQGMLDITLLIIIFCALFGVSMDYEVFLLTRIKEFYEKTGNTTESIIRGIEHSSKIITSAALIIIFLCFAFMAADILIVKAFGLGIAVAVFVDAFIIRTLLVPATMMLLGRWNWYLPKWLDKTLPVITFDPEHINQK